GSATSSGAGRRPATPDRARTPHRRHDGARPLQLVPLVFASIAPHGSISIAEWCTPEQRPLAQRTRAAFEDLGRRFEAAKADVTVLFTPHHIHLEKHMAVLVSGAMHG